MPDQLLQTLLGRPQMDANAPELPEGTGDETGLDKALSVLYGAIGIPGVPDNRWNRGGALLTAAAPFLPGFARMRGAQVADTALDLMSASRAGRKTDSPLLDKVFAANPQARPAYEKAMQSQLQQVLFEREMAKQARVPNMVKDIGAMQKLDGAGGPSTARTSQGMMITMPKEAPMAAKAYSRPMRQSVEANLSPGSRYNQGASSAIKASNVLTTDDVKSMRKMNNFADVLKAYPGVNRHTLHDAYTGQTFTWLK